MLTKEPSDITGSLHDINDDESIKSEKPTAVENHLSVTKVTARCLSRLYVFITQGEFSMTM